LPTGNRHRGRGHPLSRSLPARLSVWCFAMRVSVPGAAGFGASLLLSSGKASTPGSGWFFCRCLLPSRAAYLPFPLFIPLAGYRSGLPLILWSITPLADFCDAVRANPFPLSHDSVTRRRSPEVSSTACDPQPPDLPPVSWMDRAFTLQLSKHARLTKNWARPTPCPFYIRREEEELQCGTRQIGDCHSEVKACHRFAT
jgi:hypothetical protein